ncbi:hypothetical protein lerEdw1_002105 [Lerista edwardsae]|nr:hypothetical protein lerEdw1_002105 [Lerista edwardsae]
MEEDVYAFSPGSNRLKLTVLSEDRLQMKWKEAEGNTNGYKVSVKPMAGTGFNDSEQEVMLKTKTAKVTVGGLSPSKEYTLQIYTLNGPQEVPFIKRKFVIEELKNLSQAKSNRKYPSSAPEKAETFLRTTAADYILETKTTLPPTIETSTQTSSHFQCNTSAATDIILLVDGSWSVGRPNFKIIREFLAALVTPFNIAPDKVRVGLSQYSGDVRTEWNLDTYSTKDKLLEAIGRVPYKGGNTVTGLALNYVRRHNLKPAAGARAEATKLLVLLTDGRSQDGIIQPSQNLKNMGIEIFAVGVKHAVEKELRQIASEPLELTVYKLPDFTLLSSIVGRLSRVMCASIKNKDDDTVEELRNLSQAASHRRHPSMAPEKPETFLRTTAADYILETKATLATITEKSTQINAAPFLTQTRAFLPGPHFQCDTLAATDIVLLIDGSWSIGRPNFKLIREFLAALVTPFSIAQDKIRVGKELLACQIPNSGIVQNPTSPLL